MASVEKWTARAKSQHSNSVVAAVPASSRPAETVWGVTTGLEAAADGVVGMALGAAIFAAATVRSAVVRFRDRKKPIGDRGVNDSVALVFFDDRVEVRERRLLGRTIGDVVETHPLDRVLREEGSLISVGGTSWTITPGCSADLYRQLARVGIDVLEAPGESDSEDG